MKLLNLNEIVAQIVGFFILFLTLRVFVWKKILKLLDERKERIASGFAEIENTKKEINVLKSEYEAKLNASEEAARLKIQESVEDAKNIIKEMKTKAHEQAESIIMNAKESVRQEVLKAKEELKEDIVDLVIKGCESVVEEKLTLETDKRLAEQFISRIDKIEL